MKKIVRSKSHYLALGYYYGVVNSSLISGKPAYASAPTRFSIDKVPNENGYYVVTLEYDGAPDVTKVYDLTEMGLTPVQIAMFNQPTVMKEVNGPDA